MESVGTFINKVSCLVAISYTNSLKDILISMFLDLRIASFYIVFIGLIKIPIL